MLPESLLNAKEMADVRLFLYRFFNIRCVVSMPRNIFIDTPTLTSLIFAQKKTAKQIVAWDKAWQEAAQKVETHVKAAAAAVKKGFTGINSGTAVAGRFMKEISPVLTERDWISKGGKSPALLRLSRDWSDATGEEAASHFREIMRTAGFKDLCQSYIFSQVAAALDYEFPAFVVEEIGYKLSKRKEKARPNQLCLFKVKGSGESVTNLHLAGGECEVFINSTSPQTVLDVVRSSVVWS